MNGWEEKSVTQLRFEIEISNLKSFLSGACRQIGPTANLRPMIQHGTCSKLPGVVFSLLLITIGTVAVLAQSQVKSGEPPSSPELKKLIAANATVEKVASDFGFVEGPAWKSDGSLLFTDIPRNHIMRLDAKQKISIFRETSNNANGLGFDRQGLLIACEHGTRRVTRTMRDGKIVTLADKFEGKRLNSPNDMAFDTKGAIYFTDPPYGLPNEKEGKELDFNGVYRLAPTGELTLLVKDFDRPNGIAFSPDHKTLYVDDTNRMHVRAFDVKPDGSLTNDRVFAQLRPWAEGVEGGPDGMAVDKQGNLYVTGPGGVWVFDSKGKTLGVIVTPEVPANCGFGDPDFKTLYITARTGLYRIRLTVAGLK